MNGDAGGIQEISGRWSEARAKPLDPVKRGRASRSNTRTRPSGRTFSTASRCRAECLRVANDGSVRKFVFSGIGYGLIGSGCIYGCEAGMNRSLQNPATYSSFSRKRSRFRASVWGIGMRFAQARREDREGDDAHRPRSWRMKSTSLWRIIVRTTFIVPRQQG